MKLSDALALVDRADLVSIANGEMSAELIAREALAARGVHLVAGKVVRQPVLTDHEELQALRLAGGGELKYCPSRGLLGVFNADGNEVVSLNVPASISQDIEILIARGAGLIGDLRPEQWVVPDESSEGVLFVAMQLDGHFDQQSVADFLSARVMNLKDEDADFVITDLSVYPSLSDVISDAPNFCLADGEKSLPLSQSSLTP